MADDAKVDVEIASTEVLTEETLSHREDQEGIEMKKCGPEVDQNDSRSTNTDGAQSPASSTYADCEETDLPNSTVSDELANKETVVDENAAIVISDDENEVISSSVVAENGVGEEKQPVHVERTENVPNGDLGREHHVDHVDDYEDLDSEEYDIEGVSADEYGSHDSGVDDRENGDGEEENEDIEKKLDDDEDRRNPQYIPKRGFFYEHDDRTAGTGSENETEGPVKEAPTPEPESKRKGRRNIPDGRWQHDLYKEDEQKSKSTQELINVYGYDIRNEESAPKARRRRKYGRGPNRYTRKWDDEDAYARQMGKAARPPRRQRPLPVRREEYDAEFPALDRKPRTRQGSSRERRTSSPVNVVAPLPSKPARIHESMRNDSDLRYREERRRTPPPLRKLNSDYVVERSSRSFTKRIPTTTVAPVKVHVAERSDVLDDFKAIRSKPLLNNSTSFGPRGRGMAHGKPLVRHIVNNVNEYNDLPQRTTHSEPRMQFLPGNRGRAKRLERPNSNQNFYVGKSVNDDGVRELTEQMAATDLRTSRNISSRNDILERRPLANELIQEQPARSKRYSYQRQRLLPDSANEKNVIDAVTTTLHSLPNMKPVAEHVSVANMVQSNDNNGLHQMVSRASVPMIPENQQLTSAPPPDTSALSMSSNSLAVSASLIPLSAPPMTASGAGLQTAAPPLPIMGFFQHPQGFTNQATAAQIYTRDQNIMAAPSNQPVQLVAFLPATPMLSNTNHTGPSAPAAPPPPPPPPTYPTSVINYPQASPTQPTQPSFTSETYSMPPVTLAPIHQPEMYQSPGGVTYYNTRSQVKPRSPPPPRVKTAIPIVPPPNEN